ncbi:ribosome maturation factor RimM [Hominifimenecus sp. rT4P-3]|uniref:ribosome maturation factor RimM n=1 Tax=Hominifimenecus sp. rT4P-3 TaxID=3242979 RepID=UPI003DA35638
MEEYLRVGVFASTHGIRGEIKVYPTTDDVGRFRQLKKLIMETRKKERIPLEVEGVKFFKGMAILKFKGINDINEIEKYKGSDLLVSREDAIPLEDGEFYVADLIGLSVVDEKGVELGKLKEVLQTGANDVYVVNGGERELLLPAIEECILDICPENGFIKVHLMEGLTEL